MHEFLSHFIPQSLTNLTDKQNSKYYRVTLFQRMKIQLYRIGVFENRIDIGTSCHHIS